MEVWYKTRCKKCNAVNWIYGGDPSDLTGMDMDGFCCHQCSEGNAFPGCDPDETGMYDVGLEKPSD